MASVLDSLLNDLVGRLHEMGIGKGTAAQQPVGPSYEDWSQDEYHFAVNPDARRTESSYDPYTMGGVQLPSGMFGGKPIQAPQDPIEPPQPPREITPRIRRGAVPPPGSPQLPMPTTDAPVPVPPTMSRNIETARPDGLLTGDVLSMTQRRPFPARRQTTPPQAPDLSMPGSPELLPPNVGTPSTQPLTANMFSGRLDMPPPMSPRMFTGQLDMPPPFTSEITPFGDEYENLRGKSVEDIQEELNNPNIDVNEQGDLVEIIEYETVEEIMPSGKKITYKEPIKERVLVKGFSKDTPASDNIFNPAIK
jgi:hypothetical protein